MKNKATSVNFIKHQVKLNTTLTKGNANEKVRYIVNEIKGQVQILGCRELAAILDDTADNIANMAKRIRPNTEDLGVAIGPQAVQNIFQRVAKELTGVDTPWIITNPLIKSLKPIILDGGYFTINNYQVRYALAMLTGGRDCSPAKVQRLVHEFCAELFKLKVWRTTLAIKEPKLFGLKDNSLHVWMYTANVNNIIDCPNQ
jgi:hypothetical protein